MVQLVPVGKPLLSKLSFVPVAVGGDDFTFRRFPGALGDGLQDTTETARGREIHAGTAPDVVVVIVGEARSDGPVLQVDEPRLRTSEGGYAIVPAHRNHPSRL